MIVMRMMRKIIVIVMNLMNQVELSMMEVWRRMKLVIKILSISVEEKILEEISEQWTVTNLHTVVTKLVLLTLSYLNITYL